MSTRRQLRRESLEVYLVHLILVYRPLVVIVGLALLAYSVMSMFKFPLAGYILLVPAIYLLLMGFSFNVVLLTARLAAWIATLRSPED